jgi:hypothetical protein
MTASDCAGECVKYGACVMCARTAIGTFNGVGICNAHWSEVSERMTRFGRQLFKRIMEEL